MTETTEYEYRLAQALDRIANHAERERRRREAAGDPEALATLQQALEAERAANQQLNDRVAALHARQQDIIARLENRLSQAHDGLARAGQDIARLSAATDELAAANRALIGEITLGEDDDPIRAAYEAEIAALRQARAAEIGLMDDMLNALDTLLAAPTTLYSTPEDRNA